MDNIVCENARIMWKNLSGKPDQYNPAGGKRTFCLALDPAYGEQLRSEGWNVKIREPKDEYTEPLYYLQVQAKFDGPRPPKVVLISGNNKQVLDANSVGSIDYAVIRNVDLTVTPYEYTFGMKKGVTAYLKNMYVTIEEDPLEAKYSNNDIEPTEIPFA